LKHRKGHDDSTARPKQLAVFHSRTILLPKVINFRAIAIQPPGILSVIAGYVRMENVKAPEYNAPYMDFVISRQRPVLVGHLLVTVPAVAIGTLTLFFRSYVFGISPAWPYYVTAAVALGWQWHSAALLRWKAHYFEARD